jgi:2-oxoacid:acceptor oxidoreductase gamma subunit (pyruvate/2-ketoisovalerate family)
MGIEWRFLQNIGKGGQLMKEIRLHGRGGMGTVKAAEIIVHAMVFKGGYGNSIPFFGFERQGAPVTAFVRLDDKPIRPKTQVYAPGCVIVLDRTLRAAIDVFEGVTDQGILIINTPEAPESIEAPDRVQTVASVDATDLSLRKTGKAIPNTARLGAFVKCTGWVEIDAVVDRVAALWGALNASIVREAYETTRIYQRS